MDVWDAICARRNVREYQPREIAAEDLNRIAEAGWRAPSVKNRQPWDFVIVTDRAQLRELATVWRVAFLLGVGYPADRPLRPIRTPNRRPFSEVVHHGRW